MAGLKGQGVGIVALAAVFMGLNTFFIGLRCYTKARISKTFGYNEVGMITVVVNTSRKFGGSAWLTQRRI